MPIGLTLPFAQTTSSLGYLAFSTGELEAAYYNVKSLVLTNWGERPNHFYLGCNLIEYLFSQNTEETADQVRTRIESQVGTWLPYVSVDQVDVLFPQDLENVMKVKVKFSLRRHPDLSSVIEATIGA